MTVSGVVWGEWEETTLACVLWRSEGRQLHGVYRLLWLKQQSESFPYENLLVLSPELVLGGTALATSQEVIPRVCPGSPGAQWEQRALAQNRALHVHTCLRVRVSNGLVLKCVVWKRAAAKQRLTGSRTGAFLIFMSGCTWNTTSPFLIACDNLAQLCHISAGWEKAGWDTSERFLAHFFGTALWLWACYANQYQKNKTKLWKFSFCILGAGGWGCRCFWGVHDGRTDDLHWSGMEVP